MNERIDKKQIEDLLLQPDQVLIWQFIIRKSVEYLITGFNGRLTIDFQNHRINSVSPQDFVAGTSQIFYQMEKLN